MSKTVKLWEQYELNEARTWADLRVLFRNHVTEFFPNRLRDVFGMKTCMLHFLFLEKALQLKFEDSLARRKVEKTLCADCRYRVIHALRTPIYSKTSKPPFRAWLRPPCHDLGFTRR